MASWVDFTFGLWESIFTHDLPRYLRTLYHGMRDFPTLITGPSGTGKELVARAIGLPQYIGFDVHNRRFEADFREGFCAVNLSAFAQPLIEPPRCSGTSKGLLPARLLAERAG